MKQPDDLEARLLFAELAYSLDRFTKVLRLAVVDETDVPARESYIELLHLCALIQQKSKSKISIDSEGLLAPDPFNGPSRSILLDEKAKSGCDSALLLMDCQKILQVRLLLLFH